MRRFWAETFPDWPVITEDSDTEIFSSSQARNNAVRKAATEIVVVADADTIPEADNVV
ncbi:MAG: glycosyltransferase family 2 protein, partial [Mycobacterium sp.]|nr:glycosyltransferase family 2 protein [Mycobacterium sp.]